MTSSQTKPTQKAKAQFFALLKKTSRSFYLSLIILPSNLRVQMGLGYTLCRIADTLADSDVLPLNNRLDILKQFDHLFDSFPLDQKKEREFLESLMDIKIDTHSSDDDLIKNIDQMLNLFRMMSRTDQALIQRVVRSVIKGMVMDLASFGDSPKNIKALPTENELEQYIQWIGGEPGRFWTSVSIVHYPVPKGFDQDEWVRKGIRFGTGLQLINILRDLPQDLLRGRCYIPSTMLKDVSLNEHDLLDKNNIIKFLPLYYSLIDRTIERLKEGLAYITALPWWAFRRRMAVWLPLAIGLKTLGLLRNSENILESDSVIKIKRSEVRNLFIFSFSTVPFNRLLKWEFEDLAGPATSSIDGRYSLKNGA